MESSITHEAVPRCNQCISERDRCDKCRCICTCGRRFERRDRLKNHIKYFNRKDKISLDLRKQKLEEAKQHGLELYKRDCCVKSCLDHWNPRELANYLSESRGLSGKDKSKKVKDILVKLKKEKQGEGVYLICGQLYELRAFGRPVCPPVFSWLHSIEENKLTKIVMKMCGTEEEQFKNGDELNDSLDLNEHPRKRVNQSDEQESDSSEYTPVNTPLNTLVNTSINTLVNTLINTPVNAPINSPVNTLVNAPVNTPVNVPVQTVRRTILTPKKKARNY